MNVTFYWVTGLCVRNLSVPRALYRKGSLVSSFSSIKSSNLCHWVSDLDAKKRSVQPWINHKKTFFFFFLPLCLTCEEIKSHCTFLNSRSNAPKHEYSVVIYTDVSCCSKHPQVTKGEILDTVLVALFQWLNKKNKKIKYHFSFNNSELIKYLVHTKKVNGV